MASSKKEVDEEANLTTRIIALDLSFLFSNFLRDGAEFNMRVVRGIPEGAKALAATVTDDSLVVIFDTDVPSEIWFEDLNSNEEIITKDLN